jgi:hypothetical protein
MALAILIVWPLAANAQAGTGSIQGVVRTESRVLEGVTVTVAGTPLGAVTRADGRYMIQNVPAGAQTVRATRIGYARQEQKVSVVTGQALTVNFDVVAAAVSLDQVVVTGYGSSVRRDVTGSIASVSNADIQTMPVPRVDQAISGLVAGVQVQTTNAQPGSEMRIRVRGGNSLNGSNEPLIVVDGVIGADLNQINPNDVEAVDVLKDASATAIYGARRERRDHRYNEARHARVHALYLLATLVAERPKHIDLLSADEFAKMFMRNPNHDKTVTLDTTVSHESTDWQNTVFESAPIQSHDVRVSGSSGGTSLIAGASLFQQNGIVTNSTFNRGAVRFNLDQQLGNRVLAGTRVTYSRSTGNAVRVNDGYGGGRAVTWRRSAGRDDPGLRRRRQYSATSRLRRWTTPSRSSICARTERRPTTCSEMCLRTSSCFRSSTFARACRTRRAMPSSRSTRHGCCAPRSVPAKRMSTAPGSRRSSPRIRSPFTTPSD